MSEPGELRTYTSLRELLERPELLLPPECVLPRLGYRGRLVALCGPDKSGKSTLLAHGSAAASRGRTFLGERIPDPLRVVHMGLEEAISDAVRRFDELAADPDKIRMLTLAGADLLEQTSEMLAAEPADLIVVDSLSEYARVACGGVPDDGDSSGWSGVVRPLVALAREHAVAVVVLHHVRRSDGQYRGSSEIAAAVDALLEMRTPGTNEDPNVRHISGRGRWPIPAYSVTLRDGWYELGGAAAPLSLDALVILHVEQNPDVSPDRLAKAVGKRKDDVLRVVNQLLVRGAIINTGTDKRKQLRATAARPQLEVLS
jgi:hypothetical protein